MLDSRYWILGFRASCIEYPASSIQYQLVSNRNSLPADTCNLLATPQLLSKSETPKTYSLARPKNLLPYQDTIYNLTPAFKTAD